MLTRNCKSCYRQLPIQEMAIAKTCKHGVRPVCKACQSAREVYRQVVIRARKMPHNYLVCDDCDKIFARSTGVAGTKPSRHRCYYCGSQNLISFKDLNHGQG